MGLALVGTLLGAGRGVAQDEPAEDAHLTLTPRTMATGTRTEAAGTFPIDGGLLYVPQKCVGTQRCPLVVDNWPDAGIDSVVRYLSRGADEFGLLVLVINGSWVNDELDKLEAAMTKVLAQVAVDPDEMAVADPKLAAANPDVFNRGFVFAGMPGTTEQRAGAPRVEIFEDAGLSHDFRFAFTTMAQMADWRARGYGTKQWLGVRSHGFDEWHGYGAQATFYFFARWLHQSWTISDPAARPAPTVIDPLPLLTPQAVARLITFWESFRQEPESVLATVRHRYLRELAVPVGPKDGWPSTGMVDMAALAAAVPSVAAKLKAAGLTAQEHDAYRLALWSAIFLAEAQNPRELGWRHPSLLAVDQTSVLGKNVAFVLAHPDELVSLEQTGIWMIP